MLLHSKGNIHKSEEKIFENYKSSKYSDYITNRNNPIVKNSDLKWQKAFSYEKICKWTTGI